jgi:hypothetical protein
MNQEVSLDRDTLRQRIDTSLRRAEAYTGGLRKTNTRLLVSGVTSSGLAALVTGVTAAAGPIVGEGIPGWRLACIVGAVFAFAGSLLVGLNQQLKVGDRLTEGSQCLGRLRFLEVSMATGSRDWDEIVEEYEAIVTAYPEVI